MQALMQERAVELLESGAVDRVIGWAAGEFAYDPSPAVFRSAGEVRERFVYNGFCGANLSKYLVRESRAGGKIAVFLKPCDTYSFNQLLAEHRLARENVYVIGVACRGMADIDKLRGLGVSGVTGIFPCDGGFEAETVYGKRKVSAADALADRCLTCKSRRHAVYDELIGGTGEAVENCGRFDEVRRLEAMTPEERFAFFRGEFSRCIRCNACRDVCPACTCEKCVFDDPRSGMAQKAAANSFEESVFHVIRAFHVAGRCTDCGECSRVCPQKIPLHLLNRKFISDINRLFGEYQAGEDPAAPAPLGTYGKSDPEPADALNGGNE